MRSSCVAKKHGKNPEENNSIIFLRKKLAVYLCTLPSVLFVRVECKVFHFERRSSSGGFIIVKKYDGE